MLFYCNPFDKKKILFLVITLCKQYLEMKSPERKHLGIQIFHKNKDSRSKDQKQNAFHFYLPAMKTNIIRSALRRNDISFWVSCKHNDLINNRIRKETSLK